MRLSKNALGYVLIRVALFTAIHGVFERGLLRGPPNRSSETVIDASCQHRR